MSPAPTKPGRTGRIQSRSPVPTPVRSLLGTGWYVPLPPRPRSFEFSTFSENPSPIAADTSCPEMLPAIWLTETIVLDNLFKTLNPKNTSRSVSCLAPVLCTPKLRPAQAVDRPLTTARM